MNGKYLKVYSELRVGFCSATTFSPGLMIGKFAK